VTALYRGLDQAALDAQYNLRQAVPAHPAYFARWAAASRVVRDGGRCRLDIPYGGGKRETLDLFPAASAGPPVLVFLHGGYWQAMDKSDFSFIASPFRAVGVAVAVVNYTLAPAAGMDDIVAQVRRAVAFLAGNGESLGIGRSRFFLAGHSAGGHLAAMAMLTDWSRLGLERDPICGACAISGIFDLEPIRLCYLNTMLGLDADAARRNSPIQLLATVAPPDHPLVLAVGGRETAEFQRQQAEFAAEWGRRGGKLTVVDQPAEDHYSIVDRFGEWLSPLFTALLGVMVKAAATSEPGRGVV
jgi:arylformamidase